MDELLDRLVAAAERSAMLLEDIHNKIEELSTEVANIREAMPDERVSQS